MFSTYIVLVYIIKTSAIIYNQDVCIIKYDIEYVNYKVTKKFTFLVTCNSTQLLILSNLPSFGDNGYVILILLLFEGWMDYLP